MVAIVQPKYIPYLRVSAARFWFLLIANNKLHLPFHKDYVLKERVDEVTFELAYLIHV
jgi:hypothetical protein